jgi:hypothetical protein
VVSLSRAIAVDREGGVEVVHHLAGVYRLGDGLIANERVYLDRGEALKAAALRE